jgi:hypothetical protein
MVSEMQYFTLGIPSFYGSVMWCIFISVWHWYLEVCTWLVIDLIPSHFWCYSLVQALASQTTAVHTFHSSSYSLCHWQLLTWLYLNPQCGPRIHEQWLVICWHTRVQVSFNAIKLDPSANKISSIESCRSSIVSEIWLQANSPKL